MPGIWRKLFGLPAAGAALAGAAEFRGELTAADFSGFEARYREFLRWKARVDDATNDLDTVVFDVANLVGRLSRFRTGEYGLRSVRIHASPDAVVRVPHGRAGEVLDQLAVLEARLLPLAREFERGSQVLREALEAAASPDWSRYVEHTTPSIEQIRRRDLAENVRIYAATTRAAQERIQSSLATLKNLKAGLDGFAP